MQATVIASHLKYFGYYFNNDQITTFFFFVTLFSTASSSAYLFSSTDEWYILQHLGRFFIFESSVPQTVKAKAFNPCVIMSIIKIEPSIIKNVHQIIALSFKNRSITNSESPYNMKMSEISRHLFNDWFLSET